MFLCYPLGQSLVVAPHIIPYSFHQSSPSWRPKPLHLGREVVSLIKWCNKWGRKDVSLHYSFSSTSLWASLSGSHEESEDWLRWFHQGHLCGFPAKYQGLSISQQGLPLLISHLEDHPPLQVDVNNTAGLAVLPCHWLIHLTTTATVRATHSTEIWNHQKVMICGSSPFVWLLTQQQNEAYSTTNQVCICT